ncbi:MAG: twin-arginine translocation signal domain-containing protein [Chitinivibrionales bacterium]|nr:twin-arginine translocation signal domain-containing protein [Chitinivibrionales bacterium]
MKLSRRSFLKNSSAAVAAMTVSGGIINTVIGKETALSAGPGNKWPGRVVINFDKTAVTMNGISATANQIQIPKMVNAAILQLTGQTTLAVAWQAIFPSSLSATSKIAIKVPLGCANSIMAPHWTAVKAITDGLQQMSINGTAFPAANITIYDMKCSNNLSPYGYTAAHFPGVNLVYEGGNGSGYSDGAKGLQYAPSLAAADFLINVFRPGGHSSYVENLTLGFKNHYGTYAIDHDGNTAPGYLRDINGTGVVLKKNVLSVCVGIFGAQEGSGDPGSAAISYYNYAKTMDSSIANASFVAPTTIIMSTDPVSAEMQTIKMMRINSSRAYGVSDMPKYLRASAGVSGALSDASLNFGIIDETKMTIYKIINGTVTTSVVSQTPQAANDRLGIAATQLKSGHGAFIEFMVPQRQIGASARIEIFNVKGEMVRSQSMSILGSVNHFTWDQTDLHGRRAGNGMYLVRLTSGMQKISTSLTLMR